jgi:hypothetical protein
MLIMACHAFPRQRGTRSDALTFAQAGHVSQPLLVRPRVSSDTPGRALRTIDEQRGRVS